eukprot:scaffold13012_cov136-Skeletonema_marinoi.AAC.2
MSSANAADVDIGILARNERSNNNGGALEEEPVMITSRIDARNQPISNNNGGALEEPVITSRFDVYESIAQGFDNCGNCCYADIADGSTTSPAMPSTLGLRISGVGNVSLPVVDEQISKIKSSATHVAGSKKRGEDGEKKISSLYEIRANKIKIQNPHFDHSIKKLVKTAAYKLGVSPYSLFAKLDKLIYMEKGGFINRRRDDDEDYRVLGKSVL